MELQEHGSRKCLRLLLKMVQNQEGKDAINICDTDGNTPLIDAVRMSNFSETYRALNCYGGITS